MQPPNRLARELFAGLVGAGLNPVSQQQLNFANLTPTPDEIPSNHPALITLPRPNTQRVDTIITQLEEDLQARRNILHSIYQMILAFHYDSAQLLAGFTYPDSHFAFYENIHPYIWMSLKINSEILEVLSKHYDELYELTLQDSTVTVQQVLERAHLAQHTTLE
jgi:hypothetical protein